MTFLNEKTNLQTRRSDVWVVGLVGSVRSQVRLEVAIGHELHDDERWQLRAALGHHSQQFDHVVSFEFPEKIKFLLVR